jgi:hypothetical protein
MSGIASTTQSDGFIAWILTAVSIVNGSLREAASMRKLKSGNKTPIPTPTNIKRTVMLEKRFLIDMVLQVLNTSIKDKFA